ncbi:MAG: hypothetical protein LAT65_12145 [Saccharospirillum sp.]|nr:hypothetical protein [Saccharospirillum sp.]
MKSTTQLLLAVLVSLFSFGLLADDASNEVRIELLREDISDWVVDKDSLWLKLSEPAQARFSAHLASTPSGKLFKVYLEEVELVSLHWHGEGEPNVIMAPITEAALEILEQ